MSNRPEIFLGRVVEASFGGIKVFSPLKEFFLSPLILAREERERQSPRVARLLAALEGIEMGLFTTQAIIAGVSPSETMIAAAMGWSALSVVSLAYRNSNLNERRGKERILQMQDRIKELDQQIGYINTQIKFPTINWN